MNLTMLEERKLLGGDMGLEDGLESVSNDFGHNFIKVSVQRNGTKIIKG